MHDRESRWIMNAIGIAMTAAALPIVCHWLVSIERPLIATLAYLGTAVWLTIGAAMHRWFVRHVAEHRCLEHNMHECPGVMIPLIATWPLMGLMHSLCRAEAPEHNGGSRARRPN